MNKAITKLLILAVIIFAVVSLDLKINIFPWGDKPDEVIAVNGQNNLLQLEQELAEQFAARAERFTVSFTGNKEELTKQMTDTIRSALRHDDYSAYILESYVYTIRSLGNRSTISIEARYRETPEQTAVVDRAVDEALAAIIKQGMNDHEKIKAIHDWVVAHVEYDQSLKHYTAYEAITLGKAVCQGYSLLGYKMLDKAGINVLIAEGSVDTGEHAWNMVELDGNWYHLDLTWDDPVMAASTGNGTSAPVASQEEGRIHYNYYLKTDAELRQDHQWTREYPAAGTVYADVLAKLAQQGSDAERSRYSKLKLELGLHWLEAANTIATAEQLRTIVQSALDTRAASLEFRYTDGERFPEALKAAFQKVSIAAGYRASYEPYGKDGSLLVRIKLEY
jgi:hypothetical protein